MKKKKAPYVSVSRSHLKDILKCLKFHKRLLPTEASQFSLNIAISDLEGLTK